VNNEDMTVKIGAGVTYSMLLEKLREEKLAITNVPSLPHLNVVGSLITGSHGGAAGLPELATLVT
jgi:xylitol oxidase